MKYYKTRAHCLECDLTFEYAISQEEMDEGLADDIFCPQCGERASHREYVPCTKDEYDEILEIYEELEEGEEEEFDFDEDEEEEDWDLW